MTETATPHRPSFSSFIEIFTLVSNLAKAVTSIVISSVAVLIAVWFAIVTLRPNPPVLIGELRKL